MNQGGTGGSGGGGDDIDVEEGDDDEEEGEGEEEAGEDGVEEVERVELGFLGLCKMLLDQSAKTSSSASYVLGFRVKCLEALARVAGTFSNETKQWVWTGLVKALEPEQKADKPVLVAKRIALTQALIWDDISVDLAVELSEKFKALARHEAWTVREGSCKLLGTVGSKVERGDRRLVVIADEITRTGLKDRKYCKVRKAAVEMWLMMLKRCDKDDARREFVLPFKEDWESVLSRLIGQEENPEVTGKASEALMKLKSF